MKKKVARGLQDELERDGREVSYQFCCNMAERHREAADAKVDKTAPPKERLAAHIAALADIVRPGLR